MLFSLDESCGADALYLVFMGICLVAIMPGCCDDGFYCVAEIVRMFVQGLSATVKILFILFLLMLSIDVRAGCESALGNGRYDGGFGVSDQYRNIGPTQIDVSSLRFTPRGAILFDQVIAWSNIWASLPRGEETVMMRCSSAADAESAYAMIAGDSSYSLDSQIIQLPGVGQVWPFSYPSKSPTSTAYRLLGSRPDGGWQPALGYSQRSDPSNRFAVTGYDYEPVDDQDSRPYKVKAKHMPKIRMQIYRDDGSGPYDIKGDMGGGAYLGILSWGCCNGNDGYTGVHYGYVAMGGDGVDVNPVERAACGVLRVPRTVNLPPVTTNEVARGDTPWTPFSVSFECENGALTNSILKVGLQPKGVLASVGDQQYLLPDNRASLGAAQGVGLVYNVPVEGGSARRWVRDSSCINPDQYSYCPTASALESEQGWYRAGGVHGNELEFSENFQVRLMPLPGVNSGDISAGEFTATVNVIVTLK
ncbi:MULTISPECIES: fimbrial protein [Pseudomonas]|uniref:fimbrial protein n=1 Tax=Pseudomonas TaxID=286 RepID=UPI0023615527|nr:MULTISPECIES: fimbrial protein [Pseudomonas]WJV24461.1 fimbrial protein [Pseudomonas chlororaphis]